MIREKIDRLKAPELASVAVKGAGLKGLVVKTFQGHYGSTLLARKGPLLHHLTEDLDRFGSMELLDASTFGRYNLQLVNQFYRRTW